MGRVGAEELSSRNMNSPDESAPPSLPPESQVAAERAAPPVADGSGQDFFIVGIGASAGALEPISEVLKRLPQGRNLAVVLVQHSMKRGRNTCAFKG